MVERQRKTHDVHTAAQYGRLQAALIFRWLLSDTLQDWRFYLNDYAKFVANKTIEGNSAPSYGMSMI